jgi:cobaltochelatase CobN
MASPKSSIRIIVASEAPDEALFEAWRAARSEHPHAARMILQRVIRESPAGASPSVGLGYAESLRWFGPIDSAERLKAAIEYAGRVLDLGAFPEEDAEFTRYALPASRAVHEPGSRAPNPTRSAAPAATLAPEITRGIKFFSHAETDLLALERARADLPEGFPDVSGHSLLDLSAEALLALFGARRSRELVAIVRIHGASTSVPGLADLLALAHREGWGVVVISGVSQSVEIMPRSNVSAELASNLTAYFMAGGVGNVAQALRYAAREQLSARVEYELPRPMPEHGLYHPDLLVTDIGEWQAYRAPDRPVAAVLFYRAHVLSGNLEFVDALVRSLERRGLAALGLFTSSLRDCDEGGMPAVLRLLPQAPDVIVNTVSFPLIRADAGAAPASPAHCFQELGATLIQAVCCGMPRASWLASARGLSAIEAAMHVALPECDGRMITVPVSFKENHRYAPDAERIERVTGLARRITQLREKPNREKRIAIVLCNAGGKAQRVGGAVGLDTPASLLKWLSDMRGAGYRVGNLPATGDALMGEILALGTYDEKHPLNPRRAWRMPRARYVEWFMRQSEGFRKSLVDTWGVPGPAGPTQAPPFWKGKSSRRSPFLALHEPHTDDEHYLFAGLESGAVMIAIQPPRSFGIDPDVAYHSPDLAPSHHYAAFYRWLAEEWRADAIIHFGTHGTLEWLPGKSLALSADCAPDALLGDLPLVYPFVVNNPGEGAQAKRRAHAIIVDHLVPPLTQAETYGALATLARLVEEYYRAEVLDPNKLPVLRREIWDLVRSARLEDDLRQLRLERHGNHTHPWDERIGDEGVPRALEQLTGRGFAHLLEDLDAYLCDLGRAQIRSGLHVLGVAPQGAALIELLFAILRTPNGALASLIDAVTLALGLDPDALQRAQGVWTGPVPRFLARGSAPVTVGEMRAAIDACAHALLEALAASDFRPERIDEVLDRHFEPDASARPGCESGGGTARASRLAGLHDVLGFVCSTLAPNLARTTDETRHLLDALRGAYVPSGPAGSPSRGMAHVLPTGRNFHSVDPRGLPSPAAWSVGSALARETLERHRAERGRWPESIALSIWGTPTMRTGGDDIAQALALIGARPVWDPETRRATGVEIIGLAELGRPRIDVTLRVSGFFRDAFPGLMHLFDQAVMRILALEEPADQNHLRKHWLAERSELLERGCDPAAAARRASYRVFSSRPGAYGTGLAELMESGAWHTRTDLAQSVLIGGGWAYTPDAADGVEATDAFRRKLAGIDLVVQNHDHAEQDLFDSNDYFEFHGGLIAAVESLSGTTPRSYVGDSSQPSRPAVRSLEAQALRVHRSRIVNPKWLAGIARHGYRGSLEMVGTVDALFGFAATAGIVKDWMFEDVAAEYAGGAGREFLESVNPWALHAIVERLLEADQRDLWRARPETRARLRSTLLESETDVEQAAER